MTFEIHIRRLTFCGENLNPHVNNHKLKSEHAENKTITVGKR